jgi:hypothetical protein
MGTSLPIGMSFTTPFWFAFRMLKSTALELPLYNQIPCIGYFFNFTFAGDYWLSLLCCVCVCACVPACLLSLQYKSSRNSFLNNREIWLIAELMTISTCTKVMQETSAQNIF